MYKLIAGAYALFIAGMALYLILGPGHQWVLDISIIPGTMLAVVALFKHAKNRAIEIVETLKLYN